MSKSYKRYCFYGFDIINYLDDFAGAETPDLAEKAFVELRIFNACGIDESVHKACPSSTRMEF